MCIVETVNKRMEQDRINMQAAALDAEFEYWDKLNSLLTGKKTTKDYVCQD